MAKPQTPPARTDAAPPRVAPATVDPTSQLIAQVVALAAEVGALRAQIATGGGPDAEAARAEAGRLILAALSGTRSATPLGAGPLRDAVDRAAAIAARLAD